MKRSYIIFWLVLNPHFVALLGMAYHDYGILTENQWHFFHDLRKVRNYVHLKAADFKEFQGYTVEEANESIRHLEKFRTSAEKA